MKAARFYFALLGVALCVLDAARAQTSFVTLAVNPPAKLSDALDVRPGEFARVVTLLTEYGCWLLVTNASMAITNEINNQTGVPLAKEEIHHFAIAGPARVSLLTSLTGNTNAKPAICTLEITREVYPPDKTLAIPEGSGGVAPYLESSTNLVDWAEGVPGVYGPQPSNLFFRIRAERVP